MKQLPLCSVRNRVEFSMIHSLFTKTYLLPEDFDFPYYLSGCFDRFALRTINRSMFTWVVLLVIVACNFIRILVGLSCQVPADEEEGAERRFLQGTVVRMYCGWLQMGANDVWRLRSLNFCLVSFLSLYPSFAPNSASRSHAPI